MMAWKMSLDTKLGVENVVVSVFIDLSQFGNKKSLAVKLTLSDILFRLVEIASQINASMGRYINSK